jgi:hypothetical protein
MFQNIKNLDKIYYLWQRNLENLTKKQKKNTKVKIPIFKQNQKIQTATTVSGGVLEKKNLLENLTLPKVHTITIHNTTNQLKTRN